MLAATWRVEVVAVLDGDTVVLANQQRLRLRGIDAPEVSHKDKPGQYFGRQAGKILASWVLGRDIFLDREELNRDHYGRLVGVARLMDGRNLSMIMIEEGAAFVYPYSSDTDEELARQLLAAQRVAMSREQGFWRTILRVPQATNRYVGAKNSRRFHVATCSLGRRIKKSNQVFFSSLREAFTAGYSPARECTPWPVDGR